MWELGDNKLQIEKRSITFTYNVIKWRGGGDKKFQTLGKFFLTFSSTISGLIRNENSTTYWDF